MPASRRSRDRDDVVAAVEDPRQGQLARGDALLGRDVLDALNEREVVAKVLALKARVVLAAVGHVFGATEAPGEEAAPEGSVGDEPDSQLAKRGQDLVLDLAGPERVLRLKRSDRVHRVGAPDRLSRG